jgi:hypothetical protein
LGFFELRKEAGINEKFLYSGSGPPTVLLKSSSSVYFYSDLYPRLEGLRLRFLSPFLPLLNKSRFLEFLEL